MLGETPLANPYGVSLIVTVLSVLVLIILELIVVAFTVFVAIVS